MMNRDKFTAAYMAVGAFLCFMSCAVATSRQRPVLECVLSFVCGALLVFVGYRALRRYQREQHDTGGDASHRSAGTRADAGADPAADSDAG